MLICVSGTWQKHRKRKKERKKGITDNRRKPDCWESATKRARYDNKDRVGSSRSGDFHTIFRRCVRSRITRMNETCTRSSAPLQVIHRRSLCIEIPFTLCFSCKSNEFPFFRVLVSSLEKIRFLNDQESSFFEISHRIKIKNLVRFSIVNFSYKISIRKSI